MGRDAGQSPLKPFEPLIMCLMRGGGLQHDPENYWNIFSFRKFRSDPDNGICDPICQH